MKHFYTSQTNSDVCVMPPLVINNFPTFFPAFHSLQSNSPISDHQRQYWLKLINVPRRVTRFRGKAQLIQCISASIFTCSEVQTFIHPDPYSLVATAELLQTCTLIHSHLRPSCQIRSLTLTRIHLAVGTFCTILFQSLRRIYIGYAGSSLGMNHPKWIKWMDKFRSHVHQQWTVQLTSKWRQQNSCV